MTNCCCKEHEDKDREFKIFTTIDNRKIIAGKVIDKKRCPVKDAIVEVFEKEDHKECDEKPVAFAITDKCGQFAVGPLDPCEHHKVKVWANNFAREEKIFVVDEKECKEEEKCPEKERCECEDKCRERERCECENKCRERNRCECEDNWRERNRCECENF